MGDTESTAAFWVLEGTRITPVPAVNLDHLAEKSTSLKLFKSHFVYFSLGKI